MARSAACADTPAQIANAIPRAPTRLSRRMRNHSLIANKSIGAKHPVPDHTGA
jgi:hypothetical protein